jgi:hypothetical protein
MVYLVEDTVTTTNQEVGRFDVITELSQHFPTGSMRCHSRALNIYSSEISEMTASA